MFKLTVVQVSSKTETERGYGRDVEEALSHSGWVGVPEDMEVREVTVCDDPAHQESADVAQSICGVYISGEELPDEIQNPDYVTNGLRALMTVKTYASAVEYCFHMVWDRVWE